MGETATGARTPIRSLAGAAGGIAGLGVTTLALARVVESWVDSAGGGMGRWTIVALSLACGFFVSAGVLRLVRWRLVQDPHSALVGTALILMGALFVPVGGLARLFANADATSIVGPGGRLVVSFLVLCLVLRAMRTTQMTRQDRPGRLLPRLTVLVTVWFGLLITGHDLVPHTADDEIRLRLAVSTAVTLGWVYLAVQTVMHSHGLPWARRATPLFLGMALAEALRALDHSGHAAPTLAGVLLCAVVAVLTTRSALIDLDAAIRSDESQRTALSAALHQANGEADELTMWREQLTHDARNACAGLRAAMTILERYDDRVDPTAAERLRLAAVQEIGHIEHLLTRSSTEPSLPFEVTEVVHAVAEAARALGAQVTVRGDRACGTGRPADLAAVLKHILVNAQTHAPGSHLDITVVAEATTVTITCADNGPGLSRPDAARVFQRGYRAATSPGSGLGLHAARELMREQGGDVRLGSPERGAAFLVTLPAARVPAPAGGVRVPTQRPPSPTPPPVPGLSLPSRTGSAG